MDYLPPINSFVPFLPPALGDKIHLDTTTDKVCAVAVFIFVILAAVILLVGACIFLGDKDCSWLKPPAWTKSPWE